MEEGNDEPILGPDTRCATRVKSVLDREWRKQARG
jgi:hypothetical protein